MGPVTMIAMTGEDLDAAKVDANLFFPAQIKQTLSKWRVGFTTIDESRRSSSGRHRQGRSRKVIF